MRFPKLRIAWSVAWGLIAVLLIVLWARSYWWNDNLWFRTSATSGEWHSSLVLCSNWGFLQTLPSRMLDKGVSCGYWKQDAWERTDVGFEWRNDDAIKVPDIFVIVVAIAAGMAPWLSYRRFSLRTLLIAVTLVAVALGAIIWAINNPPSAH